MVSLEDDIVYPTSVGHHAYSILSIVFTDNQRTKKLVSCTARSAIVITLFAYKIFYIRSNSRSITSLFVNVNGDLLVNLLLLFLASRRSISD